MESNSGTSCFTAKEVSVSAKRLSQYDKQVTLYFDTIHRITAERGPVTAKDNDRRSSVNLGSLVGQIA